MLNMKKTQILSGMILATTLILSTTVMAGGSIFGGHKTRTSNPNGVTSIGAYICGDLDCPPVRVINAKNCDEVEGTEKKWGVCLCKEDYIAKGNACIPCPEHASCETGEIVCDAINHFVSDGNDGCRCEDGYITQNNGCISSDDYIPCTSADCCPSGTTWDGRNCASSDISGTCDWSMHMSHVPDTDTLRACNAEGLIMTVGAGCWYCESSCREPGATIIKDGYCQCAPGTTWDGYGVCESTSEYSDNMYDWHSDPCESGKTRCGFAPMGGSYYIVHCIGGEWESYGENPCPFGCYGDDTCAESCTVGQTKMIDDTTIVCTESGWQIQE